MPFLASVCLGPASGGLGGLWRPLAASGGLGGLGFDVPVKRIKEIRNSSILRGAPDSPKHATDAKNKLLFEEKAREKKSLSFMWQKHFFVTLFFTEIQSSLLKKKVPPTSLCPFFPLFLLFKLSTSSTTEAEGD